MRNLLIDVPENRERLQAVCDNYNKMRRTFIGDAEDGSQDQHDSDKAKGLFGQSLLRDNTQKVSQCDTIQAGDHKSSGQNEHTARTRTDLTLGQNDTKLNTSEKLAEEAAI